MKTDLPPKLLALIAVGVLAVVLLVGWFAVVSPQHSKADSLDTQITSEQASLKVAQQLAQTSRVGKKQTTALRLLAAALPTKLEMPSLLRQVQSLAVKSNVVLGGFTPSSPVALSGYEAVPIDITVTGRYLEIQHFLHRLRVHAGSTKGKVHATGRLFSVESLNLAPGVLPQLSAT